MYESSEDAIAANESVTLAAARRELGRHYCRVVDCDVALGRLLVTNDLDEPEWVPCTTKGILEWLGY